MRARRAFAAAPAPHCRRGGGLRVALLAIGFASHAAAASPVPANAAPALARTDFRSEPASPDARAVADWAVNSGDRRNLPFALVDKRNARVFVFDARAHLLGSTPALLGLGRGDDSVPGIGHRRLETISAAERTTPAGRFEAALGHDFEQDILWLDYDAALSLHRVITGRPADRRRARLASPTTLDNRISYGCINVPAAFYDRVVVPAFTGTVGIVYILPETKPIEAVFPIPAPTAGN